MKKVYVIMAAVAVLLFAGGFVVRVYRQGGSQRVVLPSPQAASRPDEITLPTESREHAPVPPPQAKTEITPGTVAPPTAGPAKPQSVLNVEAGIFTKPTDTELKAKLTPLQYRVTQQEGTEPPFQNEYWHNEHTGLYVDIVSGEPLFSSRDKYDSGTGWPSFTKPIKPVVVMERTDSSLGETRTEIVSAIAKSHLGHVFDDGPPPTGKRYCMNSAALRFIPVANLVAEGYGKYSYLFK